MFSSQSCSQSLTIKYINKTFNNQISITICSDFLSAIKALEDSNSCTYLVQLIHNEIRTTETKNIKLYFTWIRGHAGNNGNELADNLAKGARSHRSFDYHYVYGNSLILMFRLG